jgi:mannose-6-phosphate isomerase-like protein (cupin superfamily)
MIHTRPWGYYNILSKADNYQSKYIYVETGKRLSYQTHKFRNEHWFILSGPALVIINGEQNVMYGGDSIDIPVGTPHRIEALNMPVEFIEVQTGTYFGEDDIIRLEDDFGRN